MRLGPRSKSSGPPKAWGRRVPGPVATAVPSPSSSSWRCTRRQWQGSGGRWPILAAIACLCHRPTAVRCSGSCWDEARPSHVPFHVFFHVKECQICLKTRVFATMLGRIFYQFGRLSKRRTASTHTSGRRVGSGALYKYVPMELDQPTYDYNILQSMRSDHIDHRAIAGRLHHLFPKPQRILPSCRPAQGPRELLRPPWAHAPWGARAKALDASLKAQSLFPQQVQRPLPFAPTPRRLNR